MMLSFLAGLVAMSIAAGALAFSRPGGLLGGNPTADQSATARESFGGTTAAGALVDALTAMGANATPATRPLPTCS